MLRKAPDFWYRPYWSVPAILLLPLSWIFRAIIFIRYFFYRFGILKTTSIPVPVIVIGNITVGGTGKTPVVIALAEKLRARGFRPGIVSRGVGGNESAIPVSVTVTSDVLQVGDEALLLAKRTLSPVMVCKDRVRACQTLLAETDCNIILSDDGLQHYHLQRDIEIVVIDAKRQFGNQQLLPAGPLREPLSRLKKADFCLYNGDATSLQLFPTALHALDNDTVISFTDFATKKVHAVAGIGYPTRFFQTLSHAGFDVMTHEFPDHYLFQKNDLLFADDLPIVMTEKDAMKCRNFQLKNSWYLSIDAILQEEFIEKLFAQLTRLEKKDEKNNRSIYSTIS